MATVIPFSTRLCHTCGPCVGVLSVGQVISVAVVSPVELPSWCAHVSLLGRPHPCQSVVPSTHAHQPCACLLLWCQASLPASGPVRPSLGFLLRHVHLDEGFPTLPRVGVPLGTPRAFHSLRRRAAPCAVSKAKHTEPQVPGEGAEARGADAWIPGKQDPWCRHGPLRAPAPACVTLGQVCKAPELGVEETSEVPVPPPGSG